MNYYLLNSLKKNKHIINLSITYILLLTIAAKSQEEKNAMKNSLGISVKCELNSPCWFKDSRNFLHGKYKHVSENS